MRAPAPGEMQSAAILLDRMTLTDDARALLMRITLREAVPMEALILLHSLAKK